jgi:hypothetical protein
VQAQNITYTERPNGYLTPESYAEKHEMVRRFVAQVGEEIAGFNDVYSYDNEPEEIENRDRGGFWPWTEGGWTITHRALLSYAHSSGCAPAEIRSMLDSTLLDCERSFVREKGVEVSFDTSKDKAKVKRFFNRMSDKRRDEYYEFEDTWLSEGGTYFYKVRAIYYAPGNTDNVTGEPEVYFNAYLNTDLEYGRDSISWLPCLGGKADQTAGTFKRTVKLADLTEELIDELSREAIASLRAL